jgi:hypothetical protein
METDGFKYPTNHNAPWTDDLENDLLQQLGNGMTRQQCAIHFQRTTGSIGGRQMMIARRLVASGKTVEEVSDIVKASVVSIRQSLQAERAAKENARNKRADVSTQMTTIVQRIPAVTPDTPLSVLVEIRDLMKQLVKNTSTSQ